jgi:hypothetical protein
MCFGFAVIAAVTAVLAFAPRVLMKTSLDAILSEQRKLSASNSEKASVYSKPQVNDVSLNEAIRGARYGIRWTEHSSLADGREAYGAANPAQQFYSHFTQTGVTIGSSAQAGKTWHIDLSLQSLGYGVRQHPVSKGELSATDDRINYTRQLKSDNETGTAKIGDGQISEWYQNREAGLEQGFTITNAPGERRLGEKLRVEMKLGGNLRARTTSGGQAIALIRPSGETVLKYEHLLVKDSAGQNLVATMGSDGRRIWLEVDDTKAVYPLTIDPAFVQQSYLKASNTDAGDLFGASVAISGDTAVVGAPSE